MNWATKLVSETVACLTVFRRCAFAAAYLALGVSAAHLIVAIFIKELALEPLIMANWLLMAFVIVAWMRIPPDRLGTDLTLRKLAGWVIASFAICGNAAVFLKPGL